MRNEPIEIISAAVGIGGPSPEAADGPGCLLSGGLVSRLSTLGIAHISQTSLIAPSASGQPEDSRCRYVEILAPYLTSLYSAVKLACTKGNFPLIIGGDHSLSIGTIKAVADHLRETKGPDATLGLLWVDAHADINTVESSPSGNVHGMSVATLLGFGHADLTTIGMKPYAISKEHLAFVGLRDLDEPEKQFIREEGIFAATMKDIDHYGIGSVCDQAFDVVNRADGVVISMDLDVIDPRIAPAVATPVRGGLTFREAHLVMELAAEQNKLCAVELVEFNPGLDKSGTTQEIALDLIESALGKSIL